jgi:preprotein translocase subunit SecY
MAKQPGLDFQSAKGGFGELKRRLLFVIGALIVFRIGSFIPIPGIDATVLAKLLEQQRGTIIEMFNMFSGGALSRASIFVYFGLYYYPAADGGSSRVGRD